MITLTESAAREINRLQKEQDREGQYLRISVQGGGCSGLMYNMNFDEQVGEFDKVFDINGIKVVIDMKSALYLKGTTLNFTTDLTGGGFKFENPNASRSCGCGASFSA
ncbi:HesB/IscA family protein [Candidatus Zixiibacteriota bacterium]